MRSEKIQTIKKRFKNEWLLIRVDEAIDATPVKGRLIKHNPNRDTIYEDLLQYSPKHPLLVTYSEDKLPKGCIAAF